MASDRQAPSRYPELGEMLALCLEVVGYRHPEIVSPHQLGREVFECAPSGLTKRFSGETAVHPGEMSQIVERLGLHHDGILPEHFRDGLVALRAQLERAGAGLLGEGVSARLIRAVRDFEGHPAHVQLRRVPRRGTAFTTEPYAAAPSPSGRQDRWLLAGGDAVRVLSQGPPDARLLLIDHACDSDRDANLLVPELPGDRDRSGPDGRFVFPDPGEAPLLVRWLEQGRHIAAIWLDPDLASSIDGRVALDLDQPFRPLDQETASMLCDALDRDGPGAVLAAAGLFYSVARA